MGNVLFQQSCLPRWGWLGEVPRPSATTSSRGSPQPASESEEHRNNGGRRGERRGRGPSQTKALRLHPGLLPSSRCSSLTPEAPKELSTVSLGGRRMTRVLEGSYNTSTQGLARPSTRCPNRSAMPP